jgi:hypothetical protein
LVKEAFTPFGDDLSRQIKPLADFLVCKPLRGKEDDLGPHDITIL